MSFLACGIRSLSSSWEGKYQHNGDRDRQSEDDGLNDNQSNIVKFSLTESEIESFVSEG